MLKHKFFIEKMFQLTIISNDNFATFYTPYIFGANFICQSKLTVTTFSKKSKSKEFTVSIYSFIDNRVIAESVSKGNPTNHYYA